MLAVCSNVLLSVDNVEKLKIACCKKPTSRTMWKADEVGIQSGIGDRESEWVGIELGIGNRGSKWVGIQSGIENRESLWEEWELLVMMWNHHCKVHTRAVVNTTKRPNITFFSQQYDTAFLSSPKSEKSFASDQQLIQYSKFFQKQETVWI